MEAGGVRDEVGESDPSDVSSKWRCPRGAIAGVVFVAARFFQAAVKGGNCRCCLDKPCTAEKRGRGEGGGRASEAGDGGMRRVIAVSVTASVSHGIREAV